MAEQGEREPQDDTPVVAAAADPTPEADFPVVAIGASAGGFEALTALLGSISLDRMAFVVVQHLSPQHASMLGELLGRETTLPVVTIEDGMPLEPGRVHVAPASADLAVLHGVFHLMSPAVGVAPRLPIDFFFRSLAQDRGANAIGVVLSGTGRDGTLGLQAIKEAGGLAVVQDPATARFDGMPRSAIETGDADLIAAPQAIAAELTRMRSHPYLARPRGPGRQPDGLAKLFVLIRSAFGIDLTFYKHSTIERRVERRMALHKIEHLDDYVRFVQSRQDELATLYKDILISVTSFFRDRTPFEALKTQAFPRLLEGREPGAALRIWVPGCSTGEEAYSIAIALLESLDHRAHDHRIQIFGTDLDAGSIARARRGVYPPNIALDVSPERLERFFVRHDGDYQVARRIRDMLVFSSHNVIKDPPFSRLDLVSCRNLLIYLQPVLQKRVLRVVHYALNPRGFLLVGTSETVGDSSDLFALVDRKNKIYAKRNLAAPPPVDFGLGGRPLGVVEGNRSTDLRPIASLQQLADRRVLDRYGPPGVLVNDALEVLQFRGRTAPFLEHAPGAATLNLLRLVRPELHAELRAAIQAALQSGAPVSVAGVRLRGPGADAEVTVTLQVIPLQEPDTHSRCLLVLFEEGAPADRPATPPPQVPADRDPRVTALETELTSTREYLQSAIEELETSNEELKSANEELQSANEELQSTNEELETSKEELQSTNEELSTVNDELQNRMHELGLAHDDVTNLLSVMGDVAVLVGRDLRIRRFSAAAERVFDLVVADVGRSITYLRAFLPGIEVEQMAADAMSRGVLVEREGRASDGRTYSVHVSPYRTADSMIAGAVVTIVDIDTHTRTTALRRDVAGYADRLLAAIPHPLVVVDEHQRVVWVNEAFSEQLGVAAAELNGVLLHNVGEGEWALPRLRALIDGVLVDGKAFGGLEIRGRVGGGEEILYVSGRLVTGVTPGRRLALLTIEGRAGPGGDRQAGETR